MFVIVNMRRGKLEYVNYPTHAISKVSEDRHHRNGKKESYVDHLCVLKAIIFCYVYRAHTFCTFYIHGKRNAIQIMFCEMEFRLDRYFVVVVLCRKQIGSRKGNA